MDDDIVQSAAELLELGEAGRALGLLGPYARRCPEDLEGLLLLGMAHEQLGELKTALRIFTRVLEKSPDNGAALYRLGLVQLALHDPLSAEAFLRLAIHHAPRQGAAWEALANALQEQGRKTEVRHLLEEAVNRFPEDVNLHRILLLSLVDNEACVHGREVADWLAEHAFGDYDCLRALLLYALGYLDLDLAGRVAAQLWKDYFGALLEDRSLLKMFLDACPARPEHLVRGEAGRQTCPACGAESDSGEAFGVVISAGPLERLSAMAAFQLDGQCPCGVSAPKLVASLVLFPECSIACRVTPGPAEPARPKRLETVAPGELGEAAAVRPEAGRWWLCQVPDSGAEALAAAMMTIDGDSDASREPDDEEARRQLVASFQPLGSGEFVAWFIGGTQETVFDEAPGSDAFRQRAEALGQAVQTIALQSVLTEEAERGRPDGLPDWMRMERHGILAGHLNCSPWPLDHVCRCGARLEPFMFGTDPGRLYDPAVLDAAALAGRQYIDPETGEAWSGFVCDACGHAYTWALGVLPESGER